MMANENNLVPNFERTPRKRKEIAKKAGKASGEARRKRRALKDSMNLLLEMQPSSKDFNKLVEAGFDMEDIDNSVLLTLALFNQAKRGDVSAIKELRNLIGEDKPDSNADFESDNFIEALKGQVKDTFADAGGIVEE